MGLKFYVAMWKKYSDTAARQLCWKKSSNLRKITFCERKTLNKSTQIGINSAKTQKTMIFVKIVTFSLCPQMQLPRGAVS